MAARVQAILVPRGSLRIGVRNRRTASRVDPAPMIRPLRHPVTRSGVGAGAGAEALHRDAATAGHDDGAVGDLLKLGEDVAGDKQGRAGRRQPARMSRISFRVRGEDLCT